jgi:integrase
VPAAVFHGLQVVKGLRKGRSEARETDAVRPVSREQVEAIRPYVSLQVWAMVELQLLTGARSGEIVALRPMDVEQSGDVWTYRPPEHKTAHRGATREIYIGPRAQAVLSPFLQREASCPCFSPTEAEAERRAHAHSERKTPMSCGNRPGSNRTRRPEVGPGESYSTDSYRRAIRRACEAAGVETWHPHQLRHTRGTELRREMGLEAAQVSLGHTRADVTQVYAERDRELAKRTMLLLG